MKKTLLLIIMTIVLLVMTSCHEGGTMSVAEGRSVAVTYAKLLNMEEGDGYVSVKVVNPWDTTAVLHQYVLVPRDAQLPELMPEGTVVRTPLQKTVVSTSVHCALIDELGAFDAVKGVCDAKYILLPKYQEGIKKGAIADLGESMTPNIEKIIDLQPDAILLSPFQNSGSYGRVGHIGVPVIECADYMETGPLGRAEWVRFYGMLYGQETKADSIFAAVEQEYDSLKALVPANAKKPRVVADQKYGSTWYVSGANSATGLLFADAGANYVFADEKTTTAVPYDPEVVFDRAQDADLWVIKYNQATEKTYGELAHEYPNYAQMRPFREHNIYGCNTSFVPLFEDTPYHPERLLKEYIKIFHPSVLPDYNLKYFKKLCE